MKTKGATISSEKKVATPSSKNGELTPWTAPILLGGLVPSLFCMVVVVIGQFILLAETPCEFTVVGMESFKGENFMLGAVIISYLYLLVFCWIFMGTTYRISPLFPLVFVIGGIFRFVGQAEVAKILEVCYVEITHWRVMREIVYN